MDWTAQWILSHSNQYQQPSAFVAYKNIKNLDTTKENFCSAQLAMDCTLQLLQDYWPKSRELLAVQTPKAVGTECSSEGATKGLASMRF